MQWNVPRGLAFALTSTLAGLAMGAADLLAAPQSADLASEGLGRGHWHMFVAYALAWVLVFGWAVSIGRRLAEVERRVDR